jgi:hypothetical protein
VALEIRKPGGGLFREEMSKLLDVAPLYRPFAACEYPHPPEHGHRFAFKDGIDCLTIQIEDALDSFNRIR